MKAPIKWRLPQALQNLPVHTITVAFTNAPYPTLLKSEDTWYAFTLDGQYLPFVGGMVLDGTHLLVVEGGYTAGHSLAFDGAKKAAIAASHVLNSADMAYNDVPR